MATSSMDNPHYDDDEDDDDHVCGSLEWVKLSKTFGKIIKSCGQKLTKRYFER